MLSVVLEWLSVASAKNGGRVSVLINGPEESKELEESSRADEV